MQLLAIMGRGIQMWRPGSDPQNLGAWDTTLDVEITSQKGAHLPIRDPAELSEDADLHPWAHIGGGRLNVTAGKILGDLYSPKLVVCAYGHRSPYLISIDGPTESEVMSAHLEFSNRGPEVLVWPREKIRDKPSNTGSEVENILELALDRELQEVGINTVAVHAPRTATYVAMYKTTRFQRYRRLNVSVLVTEEVILKSIPELASRVAQIRNSKAFERSWAMEQLGISRIVRDEYKDFA